MKALIGFLKFCAEERNVKMFKAGARAGGETVVALADDLHTVSKLAVGSEEGAGFAILRAMFPTTANVVERNAEKIDNLEMSLFPTLPQDGKAYLAEVLTPISLDENGTKGYSCKIPMRPPFFFNVPCENILNPEPKELKVRCLEREDEAWTILSEDEAEGEVVIHYI